VHEAEGWEGPLGVVDAVRDEGYCEHGGTGAWLVGLVSNLVMVGGTYPDIVAALDSISRALNVRLMSKSEADAAV